MALFPITDLSRAADIRMRRKRAAFLLLAIGLVPWMIWNDKATPSSHSVHHHHIVVTTEPDMSRDDENPASRRITIDALRINLPCASEITVSPDPALPNQAIVSTTAGALKAIDTSGHDAIVQKTRCADDAAVTIRTGNAVSLEVTQSGSQDIQIGAFDAPVSLTSSGSGTISLGQAASLTVDGERSGDVHVGRVTGRLVATMNGSGDLQVREGTIPVLEATSRGSSDLLFDDVAVLGGRVTLAGSGDLRLRSITGTFDIETSGSGDVAIDSADADNLRLYGGGSGDISIGTGRIGILDAERRGSGDLSIHAAIAGGRVSHSGSGDVSIPADAHVTRDEP